MNKIFFITGNDNKYQEANALLPYLERLNIDLPEIQSLDPQEVIAEKLKIARTKTDQQPLIVEDTSLYLEGLNGFPGPLIKWMLQAVGDKGIYELTQNIKNRQAYAKTVIGYKSCEDIQYFEGVVDGQIVAPYGNEGFGWDAIFTPDGLNETFAEMGNEFKPEFSMRSKAFQKLKDYLGN